MHFKPVFRAAKALQEAGLAALRFNFRGVGRSEGVHDDGRGEQDDARAALDEMERRFPGVPLVLGGFSFGSTMALRVAPRDPRVQAVLAMGYPLRRAGDTAPVADVTQPRLFVQGAATTSSGPRRRSAALVEPLAPPRELVVVADADHYFTGRLDALHAAVHDWAVAPSVGDGLSRAGRASTMAPRLPGSSSRVSLEGAPPGRKRTRIHARRPARACGSSSIPPPSQRGRRSAHARSRGAE